MGKENFRSYKSQKILGRLYRKIEDAAAKDGDANANIDASDLPYDMELEVDGASEHVAGAWRSKCLYNIQLKVLLGQYRVSSEGKVWSLSKHNSRKLEECLKNAYHSLRKEFRHMFEEEQQMMTRRVCFTRKRRPRGTRRILRERLCCFCLVSCG